MAKKNSGRFKKGSIPVNKRDWTKIDEKIRERYPSEGRALSSALGITVSALYIRASKLQVRCLKKTVHTEESRSRIADALHRRAGWDCLVIWEGERGLRDAILYFTYPEEERNELWDFMATPL